MNAPALPTVPFLHRLLGTRCRFACALLLALAIMACGERQDPTGVVAPRAALAPQVDAQDSRIAALATYVETLVTDGRLASGQGNALLALLTQADGRLAAGHDAGAVRLLDGVLNLLNGLVAAGQLEANAAAPIVNSVGGLTADGIALASITAGERHVCGLTESGQAYCWGANESGQLGNGTTTPSLLPVPVSGGLTFALLDAVGEFTCGLTPSGAAHCWGMNVGAQLGNGTLTDSSVPTAVAGGLTFASLAAGTDHVCARDGAGQAYCWGSAPNVQGREFGLGFTPTTPCAGRRGGFTYTCATQPTAVPSALRFTDIGVGLWHTCGITSTGQAYCWGWNPFFCTLGLGVTPCTIDQSTPIPQPVATPTGFSALASGAGANCGSTGAGTAYCWGFGTLAGSTAAGVPTATPLPGGVSFASVALSGEDFIFSHACGVAANGDGYCWGAGGLSTSELWGNLGDGLTPTEVCTFNAPCTTTPSKVFGGIDFAEVTTGQSFSCGVSTTGEAWCWGLNDQGQLGTGTTDWASTPVRVRAPAI